MFRRIKCHLIICLAVLLASCNLDDKKVVVDNVNAKDVAQISKILSDANIDSTVDKEGDAEFSVSVKSSDYMQANKILLNIGVYRDDTSSQIMKIVSKGSMVETPLEQQFRFNQLISKVLSSSLSNLDYVVYADVFISTQLNGASNNVDLMQDDQSPTLKASIYLKVSGLPLGAKGSLIANVKKIVAGAVVGLDINSIYVVVENT